MVKSDCCGANVGYFDGVVGLCSECKEWSGVYEED